MLSRRSLRIKVMQKLYAFEHAKNSNFQMAQDFITETFAPDLNSMVKQDLQKLEGLRQLATLQFGELVEGVVSEEEIPDEARKAAENTLKYYQDKVKKDRLAIAKAMLTEAEHIYDLYLRILLLFIEFGDEAKLSDERKFYDVEEDQTKPTGYKSANFEQNSLIQALKENKSLKTEAIRRNVHWEGEQRLFVRQLFRDVIKPDSQFRTYCETKMHSPADERQILWHIFKGTLLKHDLGISYFEEADINWTEDEDVILGMIKKTLKDWEETGKAELQPLSPSWDDDKYYFEDLFRHAIENDTQYEALIAQNSANWDIERIALTDKILLKMALAEMIHFPSIPVKVTINEFIDVSKEYSTPKSGQFVNGILDVLSQQLSKEGVIRKSGRGLIDKK